MKKIYFIVLFVVGCSWLFGQAPISVSNISPVNGATGVNVRPTFNFSESPLAYTYTVFVSSEGYIAEGFSTTLVATRTLKPNRTYSWSVTATGFYGTSSGSNSTSFTTAPLSCVTNTSPINAATFQSTRPTLSWNINAGADSYDVYLGSSAASATLLANVSTNSYTIPINNNLVPNTTYYWYVVPKNSNSLTAATGCINNATYFTTGAPLSCTTNILPANAATAQSTIPTLSWSSNAEATSYDVYFGTTIIPTTLLANVTQPAYSIPVSANLLNNTTYYWYVVPKNGIVAATGCESNITSFTTASLNCVAGTSPANGQTTIAPQINLTWNATGASFYDVYLGTTNPPSTVVANVSTTTYSISNYLPNTSYFWYVVPKNGNLSAAGCVSNVSSFNTGSCAQNSIPSNGAGGIVPNIVYFTWFPFAGAAKYDLYLGRNPATPTLVAANINTNTYQVSGLLYSNTYSWYVIPKDAAGVTIGCPSSPFSFQTVVPNQVSVTHQYTCPYRYTPLNGASNVSITPTFTWDHATGNILHDYRLDLDSTIGPLPLYATTFSNTYTTPLNNPLTPNTTYYWYVSVQLGWPSAGLGCANRASFTTAPLNCVNNILPANASNTVSVKPQLTWQASPAATSFDIYFGTTTTPTTLLANVNTNSYTITNALLPSTTYYWYVVPKYLNLAATGCINNVTSFTTAPLSCVTNTSPANAATSVISPILTWQVAPAAASYDIYYGTSTVPTTLLANVNTNSYTIPTGNSFLPSNTYYWYVVPKNGNLVATGCTTNSTSFTTANVSCTDNFLPTNAVTINTLQPQLIWQPSTFATSYDVYFGTSNNPTTLLTNVNINSYQFPNNVLSVGTTYYWYIVPRNGIYTASACTSRVTSFTTMPFGCAVGPNPVNGQSSVPVMPTLNWQSNLAATSYDVYFGTTNVPTTLLANVSTNSYTVPLSAALLPNTTYYWYVVPKAGTISATGCSSNVWSFTTYPLTCTYPVSPLNNVTGEFANKTFVWGAPLGATNYDLYLGTTNPPPFFINTTSSSYTFTASAPLQPSTTYYWYAVAKNGANSIGLIGCENVNYIYRYTTRPLNCNISYSPSNTQTNVVTTPILRWYVNETLPNISYDILLSTTNPPTTVIGNTTNTTYTIPAINQLNEGTTYYWNIIPKLGSTAALTCNNTITSFTTVSSLCIPPYSVGCYGYSQAASFKLKGEAGSQISVTGAVCPAAAPFYTDISASTNVNLAVGKAYVGFTRLSSTPTLLSIWIDYNNNGGFEGNECVLNNFKTNTNLDIDLPFSIYIPANAALGTHKMRIRTANESSVGAAMQACGTYQYGETKDFTVTIVATGAPYNVSMELSCNNLAATSINAATNNNNIAIPILDINGNIAATINANGNNLGIINSALYRNTSAVRQSSNGSFYLDRNITITPSTQPSSGNVNVRLYFTAAELVALQGVVPTATISNLNVTKTSATCDATFTGLGVFLPQVGNGTLGSNYYVDVATPSFSSFFIKDGLGVLPLSVEYFKGSKQQATNILDWKLNCDAAVSHMVTLERSGDGRTFNSLQTQTITSIMCANAFTYKDATPLTGINFYRLKIIAASGEIKYSVIVVLLNKDKGFELISIAPNPLKNKALLTITSARVGKINIAVSDMAGKRVMNQITTVIAGSNNIDMNFETLAAGTYFIMAVNADAEIKTIRFVKY
jgi:hypothetical protein